MEVLSKKDIGPDDCKVSGSIIGTSSTATKTRMEVDAKAMPDPIGQQDTNQRPCKALKGSSKIQRNCPKKKNEDFFMDLKRPSKCKSMENIILFHQNVQSLTNKIDEFNIILQNNHIDPHFVCFTEHHLKETELSKISLDSYTLATGYRRENSQGGGVCIFTKQKLVFQTIDLSEYCSEKLLEICAVRFQLKSFKLIILCIYRPPTGNLKQFYSLMEHILNYLLKPAVTFLVCGDLNINLLVNSNEATKLLTLMKTYNLTQLVDFPTRITHCTETLLDVSFVDTSICTKIESIPFVNGLSDHDAQITCLHQINTATQKVIRKKKLRIFNNHTIGHFQKLLQNETWEQIYDASCINVAFNKFQEILVRHYETSFPTIYVKNKTKHNKWITKGIRISCSKKKRTFSKI